VYVIIFYMLEQWAISSPSL